MNIELRKKLIKVNDAFYIKYYFPILKYYIDEMLISFKK